MERNTANEISEQTVEVAESKAMETRGDVRKGYGWTSCWQAEISRYETCMGHWTYVLLIRPTNAETVSQSITNPVQRGGDELRQKKKTQIPIKMIWMFP